MKAMILAAGRGERMRPLTDHLPKPLLRIGDRSLIEHHIARLVSAGIQDIVINHAWLGELIERMLGSGERYGCRLHYSAEGATGLETAGGIARALPLLGEEPFWVINGDVWTDYVIDRHKNLPTSMLAHLVLVSNPPQHPSGDFGLADGLVLPHADQQWTFSGIGLYHPALFANVPAGVAKLAPLLRQAMHNRQVSGEIFTGMWADIGTPERLADANADWSRGTN